MQIVFLVLALLCFGMLLWVGLNYEEWKDEYKEIIR